MRTTTTTQKEETGHNKHDGDCAENCTSGHRRTSPVLLRRKVQQVIQDCPKQVLGALFMPLVQGGPYRIAEQRVDQSAAGSEEAGLSLCDEQIFLLRPAIIRDYSQHK
jgi:hypothetical protein